MEKRVLLILLSGGICALYICWQGCICSHHCKISALETSLEILYIRSSEGIISNISGPVCYAMVHSVREWKVSSQCFSNYPQGWVQQRRNVVLLPFFREFKINAAITRSISIMLYICYSLLCHWRLWWHFQIYVNILEYRRWKEFHPMDACGNHGHRRLFTLFKTKKWREWRKHNISPYCSCGVIQRSGRWSIPIWLETATKK